MCACIIYFFYLLCKATLLETFFGIEPRYFTSRACFYHQTHASHFHVCDICKSGTHFASDFEHMLEQLISDENVRICIKNESEKFYNSIRILSKEFWLKCFSQIEVMTSTSDTTCSTLPLNKNQSQLRIDLKRCFKIRT